MAAPNTCPRCQAPAREGSRFCAACGAPLEAARAPLLRYAPWALSGVLAVTLLVLLLRSGGGGGAPAGPEAPFATEGGGTAAPDISGLSPAERFDRLYQRIISAAQSGDQATVTRFMPMAVAAFGMLDTVTVDARYHLAMLELHVGDLAAAAAQADTIQRADPEHLFSYVIAAAVARWNKDDGARNAAYREFLQRYDREMASGKPEYLEHRSMLEELKRTAGSAGSS
jgi:hypothetical protein